jgi:hypothetical protein
MVLNIEPCPELEFFGYSIAYFDTNIYRMLAERSDSWSPVREFLFGHNLVLAMSDVNVLELSDVSELHSDLARFLLGVPSALLKTANQIIEEEVQGYLSGATVNPLLGPISSLILESSDPVGFLLERLFGDTAVRARRAEMRRGKQMFETRIGDTYENFPPVVCSDRYTEGDAEFYAFAQIYLQTLCKDWPECARAVSKELDPASGKVPATAMARFRGRWLFSLVQFYRYYLHRREPDGNDYGDFIQVLPIAYCRLAVVENELCNELNHIRSGGKALHHTSIRNVEWLRGLTGVPLGLQMDVRSPRSAGRPNGND